MERNKNILILCFESRGHGEIQVKIRSPRKDLTMRQVRAEAGRLIRTWRSKKGIRLRAFRSAVLVKRESKALLPE